MDFPELISSLHGIIATLFLMAFAGAFAELIELTKKGVRRIKWGVSIMAITIIFIVFSGMWAYIFYRAPVPDSPRSILKASGTPWVHEILFELKEHIGTFVPAIVFIALYIVFAYGKELQLNKKLRRITAILLILALVWSLATFGIGVYVTKIAPL